MSWNGFYSDFFSALSFQSKPMQINKLLTSMILNNPRNELHIEFAAVTLCALKTYGYKVYDDKSSILILQNLKNNYSSANWALMGEISRLLIQDDFMVNIDDEILKFVDQRDNGFLVDIDGVYSSQYHSYILLLLTLFGQGPKIKAVVEKAFQWCESQFHRIGDGNATGRGRFQKFGYVSIISAHYISLNKWGVGIKDSHLFSAIGRIQYLHSNTSALSWFWESPIRNKFLHKYNTLCDYNGFCDFWLNFIRDVLMVKLPSPSIKVNNRIKIYKVADSFIFFDDESQIACLDLVQNKYVSFFRLVKSKIHGWFGFKSKLLVDDLIVYESVGDFYYHNDELEIRCGDVSNELNLYIKSSLYSEYEIWYMQNRISDVLLDVDGSLDVFKYEADIYKTKWTGIRFRGVRRTSSGVTFKLNIN